MRLAIFGGFQPSLRAERRGVRAKDRFIAMYGPSAASHNCSSWELIPAHVDSARRDDAFKWKPDGWMAAKACLYHRGEIRELVDVTPLNKSLFIEELAIVQLKFGKKSLHCFGGLQQKMEDGP